MYKNSLCEALEAAGVNIPDILLPDPSRSDYNKWSVVACDQFTSQPSYWGDVDGYVGAAPSSLRLILPEIYLPENIDESGHFAARVDSIHKTMDEYLAGGVFLPPFSGFILTERAYGGGGRAEREGRRQGYRQGCRQGCRQRQGHGGGYVYRQRHGLGGGFGYGQGPSRWGLVLAVDLERYSFEANAKTLIRSSEKTVHNRLPPRTAIRRGAALELPHALMLMDDAGQTVIEPLAEAATAGRLELAYDFELMAGGGHIRGFRVCGDALRRAAGALAALAASAKSAEPPRSPGGGGGEPMLFAVGDGNHSLAAAKKYWDELKKSLPQRETASCPARYALVELINLRSGAVCFEPIHRALYNTNAQAVIEALRVYFANRGASIIDGEEANPEDGAEAAPCSSAGVNPEGGAEAAPCSGAGAAPGGGAGAAPGSCTVTSSGGFAYEYELIYGGGKNARLLINSPASDLPVAELTGFIDSFCEMNPKVKVDYIHGAEELMRLAADEGCFCFRLPPVDKGGLFAAIAANGSLPRKSFSMGEARDKRYYLEARRIVF
ncbi:MAG: DUF1015 domain-containing protein [Oscillospiraceae bacterium]|nr:DUF1015 domain-containing protein [Oscillospiraceae bacterium]